MNLKYRVKGKVNSPFILRGLHFDVNSDMDFSISENELQFVQERVSNCEVIDLEKKAVETPKPVLEFVAKTESKSKGVKTSGKKQTSGANQIPNTNNI